jgi:hypothetical protein
MTSLVRDRIPDELSGIAQQGVFEEGPLVVEYFVTKSLGTLWAARGIVRRGAPEGTRWMPNPRFVGRGATLSEAMSALRRELREYLGDPYWEDRQCR